MRVLAPRRPGGPDQLTLLQLPDPVLADGEVRVSVSAIGLNFAELVQLAGDFQIPAPEPPVPGFEVAGTVAEIGPGVTGLTAGQRVIALVAWGAYADQLVVDAGRVLPVPDAMDDLTAAAFPVAYATAHVSLVHRGLLRAGESVVVTGATGNVGRAALQVARAVGARVIAVDRSGALPAEAADHLVPPADLARAVREVTGGRGADLALDLVGGELTADLIGGLAWEGRLVTTGFASGDVPRVSLLDVLLGNISIIGEDIAGYAVRDAGTAMRALRQCLEWYSQGLVTPREPVAYPFGKAPEALGAIAANTAAGKLVLDVGTHG
ncbi:NADPH:quinone oxidoreductase family protein [Nonomuraea sp. SBT364]|uniref:NADPH:quinone oxidoreductase family protein n=1 Tax=Nonomuraea sp. SBT364 TaxID=1580530 RepID=UPI00066D51D8|nr:NADPH:quinone oxidoreductase family protein [Nonomuraea sp. SBT364]